MKRADDYESRRGRLADLTEEQLIARFWELTDELIEPLVQLAREHTTPAIERSVLLRMGFSSLESRAIVDGCAERNLLAHGAGNVVYRFAREKGVSVREAGLLLSEGNGWDAAERLFS